MNIWGSNNTTEHVNAEVNYSFLLSSLLLRLLYIITGPYFIRVFSPLQCMYLLLHTVKGTPFETPDQGKARLLTHWEQMDYGVQFTASRKFLTITPIVL